MAKQVVRTITNQDSIWSKLVKRKYGAEARIDTFQRKQVCFLVWRVVCQGKDVVEQGLRWTMGDDKTINSYSDPWISDMSLEKMVWTIGDATESDEPYVESFITPSRDWDIRKLRSAFSGDIVGRISCIQNPKV